MIANGIHETATPGSALEVTLTAGTGDGEMRISEAFAVGQTIQYLMRSSVASSDDMEEGYGTVVAGNKFNRDKPTVTYDGTTRDDSSPARLAFTTACDVWIQPTSGGVTLNIPNIASVGIKAISSRHVGDGGDNQTLSVLGNRCYLVPYLPEKLGEVNAIREELTVIGSATKYRLAIFEMDVSNGQVGVELWQSGDITPAASITQTTISPSIHLTGIPLYIAIVTDASVTFRAFNRNAAGPTQCGASTSNMRHVQAFFEDIGAWSVIPSTFTLSGNEGNAVAFQLVYA